MKYYSTLSRFQLGDLGLDELGDLQIESLRHVGEHVMGMEHRYPPTYPRKRFGWVLSLLICTALLFIN